MNRKGNYIIVLGIIVLALSGITYSLFDPFLGELEEEKEYYENHLEERYESYFSGGGLYDKMDNINESISSAKTLIFYSKIGIIFGITFILSGIVRYAYSKPEEENSDERVIICPYCNAENPEDAIFCKKCGKNLRKIMEER